VSKTKTILLRPADGTLGQTKCWAPALPESSSTACVVAGLCGFFPVLQLGGT